MVGISPWVAHANRSVYGEDADVFRPERWLEEECTDGENKMEQYFFTVSVAVLSFHLQQSRQLWCPNFFFLCADVLLVYVISPLVAPLNWCTSTPHYTTAYTVVNTLALSMPTFPRKGQTHNERDSLTRPNAIVRPRPSHLPGQEYLPLGDEQAHPGAGAAF